MAGVIPSITDVSKIRMHCVFMDHANPALLFRFMNDGTIQTDAAMRFNNFCLTQFPTDDCFPLILDVRFDCELHTTNSALIHTDLFT